MGFKRPESGTKKEQRDRLEMVSRTANLGKEGPKDRLEMVSKWKQLGNKKVQSDRHELGQQKVPRID